MNTVYYHWFPEPSDGRQPWKALRCPIILSIATLRAADPHIPIKVLCDADWLQWGEYPRSLNFEVKHIPFHLKHYEDKAGWKHLSRLFDLNRHATGTVIYSDSDVFWLKSPLPLAEDPVHFCSDGFNTGLFYYDSSSDIVRKFFELFEAYTIGALNCKEIRQLLKTYVGYEEWYYVWDEMTLTYMSRKHRDLFQEVPREEHASARDLKEDIDFWRLKSFHCNGTVVYNQATTNQSYKEHSRGLMCVLVKEWWNAINKVLDPSDIFSVEELETYMPMQFSILEESSRITSTLAEDGHYHVTPKA
jgi:hypothetical protein